jgi:hypothetical protein
VKIDSASLIMTRYRSPEIWHPSSSSASLYAAVGIIGALLGWALLEPFFQEGGSSGRVGLANAFLFPIVAGLVSASLAAVNKSVPPLFSQTAAAAGAFGLVFAVAFVLLIPAQIVFNWFSSVPHLGAGMPRATGFSATIAGRALAWSLVGTTIGLGTGLVTGQRGTLVNRMLSGLLAGLVAGVLFDPLQALVSGTVKSTWISRLAGFIILGGMAGLLTGIMEDAARKGLLLVTSGPRAGTRLVLDDQPCLIGSTGTCDLVLPDDLQFAQPSALVQKIGLSFELRALGEESKVQVNRREVSATRLTHGDVVRIDGTDLLFSDAGRYAM